jgi:hypothetical protein
VAQRPQIGESAKQHLFLAKDLDILLIKDDVTRIVTGVNLTVDRACLTLTAATALQDKYDDELTSLTQTSLALSQSMSPVRELGRRSASTVTMIPRSTAYHLARTIAQTIVYNICD